VLDAATLLAASAGLPVPIGFVAETGSTNADLADLAARGAPHGTALVAGAQRQGRGRLGRLWATADGGLALSVLVRPDLPIARAPLCTLAAAVAVAEVVGEPFRIKWPNDVLAPDRRKVCGILAELEAARGRVAAAVIGIGLNVRSAPALPTAAALAEWIDPPPRADLAARLVGAVLAWVARLEEAPADVLDAWKRRNATLGRTVSVDGLRGVAVGIDPDGALRVRDGDGAEHRVLAGDVHVIDP
jgi:BirA family biotin operon repressor/biotin-[acetyl-CoA-carboxylase] ligase